MLLGPRPPPAALPASASETASVWRHPSRPPSLPLLMIHAICCGTPLSFSGRMREASSASSRKGQSRENEKARIAWVHYWRGAGDWCSNACSVSYVGRRKLHAMQIHVGRLARLSDPQVLRNVQGKLSAEKYSVCRGHIERSQRASYSS